MAPRARTAPPSTRTQARADGSVQSSRMASPGVARETRPGTNMVREGAADSADSSGMNRRRRGRMAGRRSIMNRDAAGSCCSACKAGKPCAGRKDGGCGGGRRDALTPQEYLSACDLGIQGRTHSYIRARLDAVERLDKGNGQKCGGGYIAAGKKCQKSGGGAPMQRQQGGGGKAAPEKRNAVGVKESDKYSFKKQQKAWGTHAAIGGSLVGAASGALSGVGKGGIGQIIGRGVIGAGAGAALGAVAGQAEGTIRAAGNRTARAYGRSRENSKAAGKALEKVLPGMDKETKRLKASGASREQLRALEAKQIEKIGNVLNRNSTQIWTNENKKWSTVDRENKAKRKKALAGRSNY